MITISKPFFDQREIDAVTAVMRSGAIAQGKQCQLFEEAVAAYCGCRYAVTTSSGTTAILLAAQALGVSKGNRFITTPFTFVGTINPLLSYGAEPVFVDISEADYGIDADQVAQMMSPSIDLIVPVDLFGQVCRMDAIVDIARQFEVPVLEDACQAFGAIYQNKKAGSFGDIGAFSFYATKTITTAEGGMIVTDNEHYANQIREYRNHNQSDLGDYNYLGIGGNYRMTDIAAAIGLVQLGKIDTILSRRRANAQVYIRELANIEGIHLPRTNPEGDHTYNLFCMRVDSAHRIGRDALVDVLRANQVEAKVYYPRALHEYAFMAHYGYKKGDFPVAEKAASELIAIPVHPSLRDEEVLRIAAIITDNS